MDRLFYVAGFTHRMANSSAKGVCPHLLCPQLLALRTEVRKYRKQQRGHRIPLSAISDLRSGYCLP